MMPDDLVGRARELGELGRQLAAARAGRGRLVLVAGEAGVGKTALAATFAEQAGSARVVWGACREGEGAAAYGPWAQVLRALDRPMAALMEAADSRFRLFDDVLDVLLEAAHDRGLLVVVDDLHWADVPSLLLLQAVAGGIADAKVLVLGLHRPDARDEQATLLSAIGRERVASELVLGGLAPAAVASLASMTLGRPLPEQRLRELIDRSGGNPLFVRLAVAAGPGVLPAGIRDVVGQRLAGLPADVHDALREASVLGREFPAELADVDAAIDAGLVVADGPRLRFAHVLTQEVLYAELSTAERRRLHAKAAKASRDLDERAHHLRRAGAEDALDVTLAAARRARGQLAYEHAAAQFRAALALRTDAGLLLELAACEFRAGAVERAWESCRAAADLGRAAGDPAIVADAATALRGVTNSAVTPQIHALCREALTVADPVRHARVLAQLAVTADPFAAAEPELGLRALAEAEASGDAEAISLALHARHTELLDPGHLRERLALAERVPNDDAWGYVWRLNAYAELGERAPFGAELAGLSAVVEQLREPLWLWRLGLIRAAAAIFEGRFDLARTLLAEALAAGRRGGHDAADYFDLVFRSFLARRTGVDEAELADAVGRATAELPFFARGWHAMALVGLGRLDEAGELWASVAPYLDKFPRRAMEWIVASSGHAVVCCALGDRGSARTIYDQLLPYADRFASGAAHAPSDGPVSLYLGMLATVTEDTEVAERHLTAALATSRAAGSPPYEAISRVQFARLQLARRGPGDGPAAAANLDAALRIADRLGMAPLAAEARALRAQTPVLSIREEQVAALVAEGLSNRQIAGRLGLSERTAENHVTHILTKLGFDSRARIASWYAKH